MYTVPWKASAEISFGKFGPPTAFQRLMMFPLLRGGTDQALYLVLDEALSGLDLSTQAQIANLLLDLQAAHGLTYLLISHDLALVARLADTIAVISAGKTVEVGPTHQIISTPRVTATQQLVASAEASASNLVAIVRTT